MNTVFLNIAYGLMLAAFLIRDVLWLRTLLVVSQLFFIAYALLTENLSMTVWNVGFIAVNAFQAVRIFKMRKPITLSPGLDTIYRLAFRGLTRREFLYFWQTGREKDVADTHLVRSDSRLKTLFFILEGKVSIIRGGKEVTAIGRGSFIAESSDILGEETAGISARAAGPVRYICWDEETLKNIREVAPEILIKIQKIVGGYLTRKLRAALDD